MTLGQASETVGSSDGAPREERSVLERLSPAGRVLCTVLTVAALATAPLGSPVAQLAAAAVVLLTIAVLRPSWHRMLLRGVAVVLAITAAVLPFFLGGNPAAGVALTLRAGLACAAALVFADGLARTDLGAALRALGLPAGFATVIASLQQQARIIGDEGRRVLLARRLRGARGRGLGLGVLSTLFVRSARRAERVDFARSLRGYRIDDSARAARLTATDLVPLAMVLVLATAPHWLASLLAR